MIVNLHNKGEKDSDSILYRGSMVLSNNIATITGIKVTKGGPNSDFAVFFPSRQYEVSQDYYEGLSDDKKANFDLV